MAVAEDYYALLEVPPHSDGAVIRSAYRALMRRHHPDVSGSTDAMERAMAINEAYACLRDETKRAAYDWERNARPRRPRSANPSGRPAPMRPVWTGPSAPIEPSTPWYRPSWGKAMGLGVAGVITAITFTVTSFIPPVGPAAAKAPVEVIMRVGAKRAVTVGGAVKQMESNMASNSTTNRGSSTPPR